MNDSFFNDHDYESILTDSAAEVIYCDTFVDGEGNKECIPKMGSWSLYWKHGVITFDSLKDEAQARKAAALFIFLFNKSVPAHIAERCAEAYVLTYKVRQL